MKNQAHNVKMGAIGSAAALHTANKRPPPALQVHAAQPQPDTHLLAARRPVGSQPLTLCARLHGLSEETICMQVWTETGGSLPRPRALDLNYSFCEIPCRCPKLCSQCPTDPLTRQSPKAIFVQSHLTKKKKPSQCHFRNFCCCFRVVGAEESQKRAAAHAHQTGL